MLQETVFTGAPVICEDIENDPRVTTAIREYFKSKGTKKYPDYSNAWWEGA